MAAVAVVGLVVTRIPGPRLVTNEYAHRNGTAPDAVVDPNFDVTSGSLFARGGAWWTGQPDDVSPDPASANGTDSSVFRMTTRQHDFGSVRVSLELRTAAFVTTGRTPAEDWDGVHILLRYQSQYELYYASVDRRDGSTQIKKKVPGGASNGGTYYTLASAPRTSPAIGAPASRPPISRAAGIGWQPVSASVDTEPDGSVRIGISRGSERLLEAVDDGRVGGAPITRPGAIGIRGDNCEFEFRELRVEELHGGGTDLYLPGPIE